MSKCLTSGEDGFGGGEDGAAYLLQGVVLGPLGEVRDDGGLGLGHLLLTAQAVGPTGRGTDAHRHHLRLLLRGTQSEGVSGVEAQDGVGEVWVSGRGTYCAALARVGHVDLCATLLPDLGQVGALLANQGRDSLTRHLR